MSEQNPAETPADPPVDPRRTEDARRRADRRRRLAEVFGDVLPDTTRDEQGGPDSNDERLRRDVPPHH